ncbi:MAG TPA: diguanylate cyclase [Thermoanaerobaculia bacterium]|jgi:two-component system cell cycle response regulator|nr:diguanylate cyclase [Thermoanaerobaculia bacterium]
MSRQILVVDDSELSRTLIKRMLQKQGFGVLTAADGAEGAVTALRDHPDAVVTDLEMPVMDGYQLARLLKSDPATADIPLLILTSHGEASSRFWGLETGADAYLVKDELDAGLLPAVEQLLLGAEERERDSVDPPQTPLEVLARVSRHLDARLLEAVLVNRILERGMQAEGIREAAQAVMGTVADLVDLVLLGVAVHEPDESVAVHLKAGEGLASGVQQALIGVLFDRLGIAIDAPREVVLHPADLPEPQHGDFDRLELFPLPMRGAKGLLAVLPKRPFADDSRERLLLRQLSSHLGLVLDNARLAQRLRELSMIDGLTRLLNRRTVHQRLGEEWERARRYGGTLSIVLCDLDYFKAINDTHGHLAGDAVLVSVADVLRLHARAADIIGRYGGEEFLLLLPSTELDSACRASRRLLEAIAHHPVSLGTGEPLVVTASAGVAALTELSDEATPDALLALADHRLYEAKAAGRNRSLP